MMLALNTTQYAQLAAATWLVICAVWLVSLKRATADTRRRKLERLAVWLGIGAIEAACVVLASTWAWAVAYGALWMVGLWEIARLSGSPGSVLLGSAMVGIAVFNQPDLTMLVFLAGAALLFVLPYHAGGWARKSAAVALSACFSGPLFALLRVARPAQEHEGAELPVIGALLLMGHLVDISAGFAGKWGKGHPFKRLSPNKTWLGYIAGLLAACVLGASWFRLVPSVTGSALLSVTLAAWLMASLGDLVASKFKRVCAAKDFGSWLGPHGGAGDRLDAMSASLSLSIFVLSGVP